jgi:tubulin alpha
VLLREAVSGKLTPRTLFFDTDPTTVDQVRAGSFRDLFDHEMLVSGKEDTANNYFIGLGHQSYAEACLARVQHLAESCEHLQGFLIFHSIGGGTGSGFTNALL